MKDEEARIIAQKLHRIKRRLLLEVVGVMQKDRSKDVIYQSIYTPFKTNMKPGFRAGEH